VIRLCRVDELPEGETKGFWVEGSNGQLPIFLVNWEGTVHGYVNSCPHVGTPLDWLPDRFLSPDDAHLMCATHGAIFQPEDGRCVGGPCVGRSLTRVPIEIEGADIHYAGD
jgi:nitrite reductase/ring-hydroxylating ferredoxin subunit